ncbi:MAG: hypothetical protein LBD48_04290 [Treponema sp.]|jgi:hypothetical protein|nr:hypothetical protein [Treponema sp.]
MQKARAFFLLTVFVFWGGMAFHGPLLHAQEPEDEPDYEEPDYDDDEIPVEPDWDLYRPELYSRGDQMFTISAGTVFPVVFLNNGKRVDHHLSPPVGGALSLAYNYFLGAHFNLGGEVGVMFNNTLAKGTLFMIPIGLRAGYQFILRRFEFPLFVTVGFAPQRYLNYSYFGFFMKGGASAFFRFSPDWSFGLNLDWNWLPQWPMENGKPNRDKNMDGNIAGLTLSARYHF